LKVNISLDATYEIKKGKVTEDNQYLEPTHVSKFSNLLLDAGLDRMGEHGTYMTHLYLGAGTSTPDPSNTALDDLTYMGDSLIPIDHTISSVNSPVGEQPYAQVTRIFRVQPRGSNFVYSEIGVGHHSESGSGGITDVLLSRTLIKGLDGNPAVLSVLGDEYLDVTYELRLYMPTEDLVTTIMPTGKDTEPRTLTMRAAYTNTRSVIISSWGLSDSWKNGVTLALAGSDVELGSHAIYDGPIGSITSGPSGNRLDTIFNAFSHEFVGNRTAVVTLKIDTASNIGTWRSILLATTATSFQCQFDPPFDKTLEDSVELSYSVSWGRREPNE
jgi:hypothetical protein